MLYAYFNSPASRITVHNKPDCIYIRSRNKTNQRVIHINRTNIEFELEKLKNKEMNFTSKSGFNDAWFYIDLGEFASEENLVKRIKEILGQFYGRLARAEIRVHCLRKDETKTKESRKVFLDSSEEKYIKGHRELIPDREGKTQAIINTITSRIADINRFYRRGPSLYFYKRILALRKKCQSISLFLSKDYNLEILYAVLVSWDMNSRGAKLKYFDNFKKVIISCVPEFEMIEDKLKFFVTQRLDILHLLRNAYLKLELMESSRRLVSNSKCLHFLFPSLCMPMDGTNTLQYLFNNTHESPKRYLDIIRFSFEIMQQPIHFEKYLDDDWNHSIPKLIDNAIILLQGKSIKSNKSKYTS